MTRYIAEIGKSRTEIEVESGGESLSVDGRPAEVSISWLDPSYRNLSLLLDGHSYDIRLDEADGQLVVTRAGHRYECKITDARLAATARHEGRAASGPSRTVIKSPMPGLVIKVLVQPDVTVQPGDRLIVLEAMKMENDVKAARPGRVSSIAVVPGQKVEGGQVLLVIE